MINNNDLDITLTQGDVLDMVYCVEQYKIQENDNFELLIKKNYKSEALITAKQFNKSLINNKFRMIIPDTRELLPGSYLYSITLKTGNNERKMMWTAILSVEEAF